MQFFSGDAIVFSKKINILFDPEKVKKKASKVSHNNFTVQPRPTAHSPELIFHIMISRDHTSVLLSVVYPDPKFLIRRIKKWPHFCKFF